MDKLKLSEWGERLKTGGAQMGRIVSGKMKEILQTPTMESKMVDEATLETLEEPNWGLNMRICSMINRDEFNGTEIVKALKKKISGKSVVSQKLSLDLLEACTMNCDKVFSEVASEKVLDEMVKMIENPQTDHGNRNRASQLIRAWGQSQDLVYLPVFHQTYMSLKERNVPSPVEDGNSLPVQYSLESYLHRPPIPAPERYPVPVGEFPCADNGTIAYNFGSLSVEEKKSFIVETRNSVELLSSMLNTEEEPKAIKEDLMVSMLEKCRQAQPALQMLIESTGDDEGMLFEALSLHDELEHVISRYEELVAGRKSLEQLPEHPCATGTEINCQGTSLNEAKEDALNAESYESSSSKRNNKLELEKH